jgi:signal peptidase I
MIPTLKERDVLLVNEFAYRFALPRRGDIVVFKPPVPSDENYIKRVIAVPGDTLRISGGVVYVDGRALHERYERQEPTYNLVIRNYGIDVEDESGGTYQPLRAADADVPPRAMWQAPDRVPKGFYFVMGDNRNDSEDSHVWGFAQLHGPFAAGPLAKAGARAGFVGRAFLVLWPLNRIRILN